MPPITDPIEPPVIGDPQIDAATALLEQFNKPKEDVTVEIDPQITNAQNLLNKFKIKQADNNLTEPEVGHVAKAAREIEIGIAALDDKLFLEAQSEVSTLKRLNQIRAKFGEEPLTDLPWQLRNKGFVQNLKNDLPVFLDKLAQAGLSGVENTSIGLGRAIYKGEAPTRPPEGAGFEILSEIISFIDPVTFIGFGAGGIVGKKVAQKAGTKIAGRVAARAATTGTALGGITLAKDPLQQQAVEIPQVVEIQTPQGPASERTISVEAEELNDGRITLIPTIIEGKQLSNEEAVRFAVQSRLKYPDFDTHKEADEFAERRSRNGGATVNGFLGERPDVDIAQTAIQTAKSTAVGAFAAPFGLIPGIGLPAEIAAFATAGAGIEGRLPDEKDFIKSTGVILGLKAAGGVGNKLGNALFKRSRGEPLSKDEQSTVDQTPDSVKEQILQDAMKGLMKDFTLNKEALLTPQGAAEFVARHPSQAKQLAKSENVSRKDFAPIKDVVPDAEVNKWSKPDRQKFQALVAEASGKEVVAEIPTEKETQDDITRTQQEAEKIDPGQKVERVEGPTEKIKGERQEVAVTEELPVTGPKLTKVQEIVVDNAQKTSTPDTPPENVPVVPVNSLVDAKRRGLNPAKKFYNYLIRGGHHEDAVESNRIRDRAINSAIRQAQFGVKEYDIAARKTYGITGKIPEADIAQINLVSTGKASPDTIPETMRDAVKRMRVETDAMSQRAIDEKVVQGKMAATFTTNKGVYWNRSYRIFEEPNFFKKVPAELRNKATAVFRGELENMLGREPTHAESDAYIQSFLYESAKAGGVLDAFARGKSGVKELSILKERNEGIPDEIKALWGERTDPRAQYANSIVKTGSLIASAQSLTRMREQGLGKWLFEQPTGDFIAKIDDGMAEALYPLSQGKPIYTLPVYDQAMRDAFNPSNTPPLLKMYYQLNAGVKWAKTAGSVMGIQRNFFGNPMIAWANGHLVPWKPVTAVKGAFKAAKVEGQDVIPSVFDFLKLSNKQQQAEVLKLIDMGVMHDASRSGELRQIVKDAQPHDTAEAFTQSMIKRGMKLPFKKMGEFFRAGDDFWHAHGYYSELDALRKVYPNKSTAELEQKAARKVRMTYPTYSKAPFAIQQARKAVFIGDFVTFSAEMIRSTINIPRLAFEELKIPEERAIGARRAFGFLSMVAALGSIGPASRLMTGVTTDEEEAMRVLGPEWMENSTLMHLGREDRLKYKAIDTTYSLPQGFMSAPIHAALRGEEPVSLEEGPLREAFRPFFNETILFGTVRDILANKQISRESDAPIRNKEAGGMDQAIDIVDYAFNKLDPGTFDTARKIYKGIKNEPLKSGRVPDVQTEVVAATTGQRIWTYDVPRDLGFKAREFVGRRKDARKLFYTVAFAKDASDADDISEAYDKAIDADRALFGKLQEATNASKILGMNDDEIRDVFADKRVSIAKTDIDNVISGPYDEDNLIRDIVWQLRGKNFDEKIPRILDALGVSESEARGFLFDEFKHKGTVPQSKTLALYLSRIRRRMDQGE